MVDFNYRFQQSNGFLVIGMRTRLEVGDPQGAAAQLWEHFIPRAPEIQNRIFSPVCYGITRYTPDVPHCHRLDYLVAVKVSSLETVPEGMISHQVPPQHYVIFEHHGPVEQIGTSLQCAYRDWLPALGLLPAAGYDFERYDERFSPQDEDSMVELWIPVQQD